MERLIALMVLSLGAFSNEVVFTGRVPLKYDIGQNLDIYVLNLETQERERITFHEEMDYQPAISKDGKWLAFRSDKWRSTMWGTNQLALYNRETKELERIPLGRVQWIIDPTFSPDSRYLYFGQATGPRKNKVPMTNYEIMQLDLKTREVKSLTETPYGSHFDFSISPDGKRIVYRRAKDSKQLIRILNLETGEDRPMDLNRPFNGATMNPTWRDNHRIVYRTNYGEKKFGHDRTAFEYDLRTETKRQIFQFDEIYKFEKACWINPNKAVVSAADEIRGVMRLYLYEEIEGKVKFEPIWLADTEGSNSNSPDC